MSSLTRHIKRHRWFYLALACGVMAYVASKNMAVQSRIAVTGDTFYLTYLILIAVLVVRAPVERFRDWADDDDEGIFIIMLITIAAVTFSLTSIFSLLNGGPRPDGLRLMISLASAPLAWFVLHTVLSLHYAHVYYAVRATKTKDRAEDDGLQFPGTKEPESWDFLYYSFVVGMTAQVSDVQVTSTRMRQLTLIHGIVSFLFNTVLIALAVNVVVALAQTPK
jgi:uncharacterized membrane protein